MIEKKTIPSHLFYEAPIATYHMEKVLYTKFDYSTAFDFLQFLRTLYQQILFF